jgi:hypothetical protein
MMPNTKMTYTSSGSGKGWVGELWVTVQVWKLAKGQYSSKAKVPALFWSASDGNMMLLPDGILQVRYPSNGIVEYWQRPGQTQGQLSREVPEPTAVAHEVRALVLVLRRVDGLGLAWHWGLGVGYTSSLSIYEVAGADNAIVGPRGTVCGLPLPGKAAWSGTRINQFAGYIELPRDRLTSKTDSDIESFCRQWRQRHPVYNAAGPNCQTFTDDLHIFLTGQPLEFHKFIDGKRGPEKSSSMVWLDASKKPK